MKIRPSCVKGEYIRPNKGQLCTCLSVHPIHEGPELWHSGEQESLFKTIMSTYYDDLSLHLCLKRDGHLCRSFSLSGCYGAVNYHDTRLESFFHSLLLS